MKKEDPQSGTTIEIPEGSAPHNFPYGGFWNRNFPTVARTLDIPRASAGDTRYIVEYLVGVLNGDGRVFLADRVWEIGETLTLNNHIAVSGYAGNSLGAIDESYDNGRSQVARQVFERPARVVFDALSAQAAAGSNLEELAKQRASALQELYNAQTKHAEAAGRLPSEGDIREAELAVNQSQASLNAATNALGQAQQQQAEIQQRMQESAQLQTMHAATSTEVNQLQQVVNNTLNALHAARNANNTTTQVERAVSEASQRHRDASRRLSNLSSRLATVAGAGNMKGIQKQLNAAISHHRTQLDTARGNLAIATRGLNQLMKQRGQSMDMVAKWEGILQEAMITIGVQDEAIAAAEAGVRSTQESISDNDIIRIWADHLEGVSNEIEELMFKELRSQKTLLTWQRGVETAATDSSAAAAYSDYEDALEMISDMLSTEEYELLRSIGELGYSQSYVPGGGRIMALMDMNADDRRQAYRNLIEEIITMGEGEEEKTGAMFKFGPLTFDFSRDVPLEELRQLLVHLTDVRPSFSYRRRDEEGG